MTTPTPTDWQRFIASYRDWTSERIALSAQEESGKFPPADAWHGSDDTAVDLLRLAAAVIASGSCLDCGNGFADSVADDELLVEDMPDGKYGDAGNGFCLMCDLGRQANVEDAVAEQQA